jgi:hypothetical protein
MSKILDVFGRAEGVLLSAIIYFFGFMLTASAQNAEVFVIARSMSAFAGQGLQLAQQIIIADTTTLANRGLITSTISLPWLVTTFIGPPLGAWCQSKGEVGYRAIYFVFAIFTPLASLVLVVSLAMEWRMIKLKYASQLSDRERGEEVGVRWIDKSNPESALVVKSFRASAARVWTDLDVVGLCTLTVGCSLVLLPLSLAAITSAEHGTLVPIFLTTRSLLLILRLPQLGRVYSLLSESLSSPTSSTTKQRFRRSRCFQLDSFQTEPSSQDQF